MNSIKDDIIHLNVSGETKGFVVSKSLLKSVPGSSLDLMFSGWYELKKVEGKYFIDWDPDMFRILISYLRNS